MERHDSTRRRFLGGAALTASLAATAAPANAAKPKPAPKANTRVLGANDRINVAFIGNGMQFYGLLDRGFKARKDQENDFDYAAVCDVWEPRLKHAQEATKAEKTYRDYREIIARPDIDGVVIAVPDHWHYPMASEALLAGKDVYLEKPMTYTIPEAAKLNDLVGETKRVLQVGGTGPSTRPLLEGQRVHQVRQDGQDPLGPDQLQPQHARRHVGLPHPRRGQRSLARRRGHPRQNLDWNMWLGPAHKRPFSAERYFRWRKYWDYSGGNATDLLYHRLGMMSTMIGFDFPTRVTGAGGIYVQKNREVPDTYMTMVEYPGEYAVNMISCMGNQTSAPHVGVRQLGHPADRRRRRWPATPWATSAAPRPRAAAAAARWPWCGPNASSRRSSRKPTTARPKSPSSPSRATDLVDDWLDCMRSRGTPVYNVAARLPGDGGHPAGRGFLPAGPHHGVRPGHAAACSTACRRTASTCPRTRRRLTGRRRPE